jgi:membrane protein implicated in regulation of membrane protease activity
LVLLLAVGVVLLWVGRRAELGRLRCWTIGAGATVVVAVLAMAANRLRSRRHRAGQP